MSTDRTSRRARSHRRRTRAFLGGFAIVIVALTVVALAGAAATTAQGPRTTAVHVDPKGAIAASGSRLILTTTQSLAKVDDRQVTVSPAAPFTVDTSGRSIGIRFGLPLHDDTKYTVTVRGLEGVGGGPTSTLTESFQTPALRTYLLRRGENSDTIFRSNLTGEDVVPVLTLPHIEDFRATSAHLVVSGRTDEDKAQLLVSDLDGEHKRNLPLPGDGYLTNLQSADRDELIGYTFSDRALSADSGRESALFIASLKDSEAKAKPSAIIVTGADVRVADWRFVPDTDSVLVLTFDGRLSLTGPKGGAPVSLGNAMLIDGIARGSSQAVVERADGLHVIDLTNGDESPLVEPTEDLGNPGKVSPVPGHGAGTVRIFSRIENNTTALGSTIALVTDDGTATPVMQTPATDAVLQTCVSPSGRYVAVLVAPDTVKNPYDGYELPMPQHVETHIIELGTGGAAAPAKAKQIFTFTGFDSSWCQAPPQ